MRILCGKDTDSRFDRTPLILKSSLFTLDWQTKSQSVGFVLRFVLYDLAKDGLCPKSNQFQCRNHRCIDSSLICSEEDSCADRSQFDSIERTKRCPSSRSKQHYSMIFLIVAFSSCIFTISLFCILKIFLKEKTEV